MAQIDNMSAISNYDEIMDVADALMISRTQLGMRLPARKVCDCVCRPVCVCLYGSLRFCVYWGFSTIYFPPSPLPPHMNACNQDKLGCDTLSHTRTHAHRFAWTMSG